MASACKIGQLFRSETVVFLCDMQEKFRQTIQYFPQIVTVASRVLNAAKFLDMPVIVTEQYPKGLGPSVPELGLQNYPDIKPIAKTKFSMMNSEVESFLKSQKQEIKSVILCGIETHVCVQGTALSLLEKGFDVHVVVDACSSRSMVDRMFGFERIKASGAWLTTSESVILGLVGDAAHPKFKEVQKIIWDSAPDTVNAYYRVVTIICNLKASKFKFTSMRKQMIYNDPDSFQDFVDFSLDENA